ncbi:hypothetical protein DNTS_005591 [Danionella cerebrum]|uniref:PX domain-containing protein n=1 Tax=Danionella cerebrum TaxID=2873325 RepID=A0A553NK12_9TELE|nr:hypothetical protein DNTS_005591 [Danionella translucida]
MRTGQNHLGLALITSVRAAPGAGHQQGKSQVMDISSLCIKEFINVWVRDPQVHKKDFWHAYISYEICLHTNSMCFRKKTSCVRRRYSEFVWLRQAMQNNAPLIDLPKLPARNPFFNRNNDGQITQRMKGLEQFLIAVLHTPLLLSDSRLHLFLQSQLSIAKMDACAQGYTHYTVAQAIQRCVGDVRFPMELQHQEEDSKTSLDSDGDSTASSGLGSSIEPGTSLDEDLSQNDSFALDLTPRSPEGELSMSMCSPLSNFQVNSNAHIQSPAHPGFYLDAE